MLCQTNHQHHQKLRHRQLLTLSQLNHPPTGSIQVARQETYPLLGVVGVDVEEWEVGVVVEDDSAHQEVTISVVQSVWFIWTCFSLKVIQQAFVGYKMVL